MTLIWSPKKEKKNGTMCPNLFPIAIWLFRYEKWEVKNVHSPRSGFNKSIKRNFAYRALLRRDEQTCLPAAYCRNFLRQTLSCHLSRRSSRPSRRNSARNNATKRCLAREFARPNSRCNAFISKFPSESFRFHQKMHVFLSPLEFIVDA